jgi:hypothetical protein
LSEPRKQPQAILNLVSAVAGEAPAVPGTARSAMLMRVLPIGSPVGPAHETAARPHVPPRPATNNRPVELR